jgi:hypothetical protein
VVNHFLAICSIELAIRTHQGFQKQANKCVDAWLTTPAINYRTNVSVCSSTLMCQGSTRVSGRGGSKTRTLHDQAELQ